MIDGRPVLVNALGVVIGQIDLDVQRVSQAQRTLAWVIAGLLVLALVVVLWRSRYAGLPGWARRRVSQFAAAKAATSYRTARFTDPATLQTADDVLLGLLDGDEPDRPSTISALGQAHRELLDRVLPAYYRVPRPVRRLLALGLSILVLGPVAVSTAAIVSAIEDGGQLPSLGWLASRAVTYTGEAVSAVHAVVTAFPFLDVVWAILLGYGLLLAEWLYEHWPVWVVALLVGALLIHALERRLDEPPHPGTGRRAILHAGVVSIVVWIVGVGWVAIGRATDAPDLGAMIGAVAALLVAIGAVILGTFRYARSVRRVARTATTEGAGTGGSVVRAYVVARHVWGGLAVLAVPFVLAYAAMAALALPAILAAWTRATLTVQAGTVFILLIAVAGVVLAVRDAWPELRAGLGETAADQQLRLALTWYGFPLLGTILGYILAYSLTRHIPLALGIAVAAGLLTPKLQHGLRRVKYAPDLGRDRAVATRVTVEATPLTVDDQTDYYARINGSTELLAPTPDDLVDAIQHVGTSLFHDGRAPPTVEGVYHDAAARVGLDDYREAARKSVEAARKDLYHALRHRGGVVEYDELASALDDDPDRDSTTTLRDTLPGGGRLRRGEEELGDVVGPRVPGAWRFRLDTAIRRGNIDRYRDREGRDLVVLRRDPFRLG